MEQFFLPVLQAVIAGVIVGLILKMFDMQKLFSREKFWPLARRMSNL